MPLVFDYDGNGRLIGISDRFGNRSTIERSADGTATAIVSPDGLATELAIDGNGKSVKGMQDAANLIDLEMRLKRGGLDLISGKEEEMIKNLIKLMSEEQKEGEKKYEYEARMKKAVDELLGA